MNKFIGLFCAFLLGVIPSSWAAKPILIAETEFVNEVLAPESKPSNIVFKSGISVKRITPPQTKNLTASRLAMRIIPGVRSFVMGTYWAGNTPENIQSYLEFSMSAPQEVKHMLRFESTIVAWNKIWSGKDYEFRLQYAVGDNPQWYDGEKGSVIVFKYTGNSIDNYMTLKANFKLDKSIPAGEKIRFRLFCVSPAIPDGNVVLVDGLSVKGE